MKIVSKEDAAKVLGCDSDYLDYYAWPQLFGSTAGPFGGIGGQAMTTFTLHAWLNDMTGESLICCGDRIIKKSTKFKKFNVEY